MAVRTFHRPATTLDRSLNQTVPVVANAMPGSDDQIRSSEAAKKATDAYSASAKDPLKANHDANAPKRGITFAAQDKLPKLPIPELDSSMHKYLEALKPLQSVKEQNESEHAIKEFMKHDGPELQEKLRKYAAGKANYIEQFCKYS
jgi:carnitine O-acetyltransferase